MSIPVPFRGLVDDAAVFPPGLAPLAEAVPAHATHRASAHRDLVGPFIVGSAALAEAAALAEPRSYPGGLPVSVVVPDAAALPATLREATAHRVDLRGLEVKLTAKTPLADQIGDIAAITPPGVATYIEMPRPAHPEWPTALDAVARHGLRLKFRTGGTEPGAFPTEEEVARWIHEAVRRDLPFKCTAGLHHAVRHTGGATGFEHHGYLNILLATLQAHQGADTTRLVQTLAERDGDRLAEALRDAPRAELTTARASFLSYGSCSIDEPLADLAALDLLDDHLWENA